MSRYLIIVILPLLSLLLAACQSTSTPLTNQMPPYVAVDGTDTIAGVPLYPGSTEIKGRRSRFANRLTVTYMANAEPQEITDTLKRLLLHYGFEDVASNEHSKDQELVVARKPQVVALLNISWLAKQNGVTQSIIVYSLVLRSPGGS